MSTVICAQWYALSQSNQFERSLHRLKWWCGSPHSGQEGMIAGFGPSLAEEVFFWVTCLGFLSTRGVSYWIGLGLSIKSWVFFACTSYIMKVKTLRGHSCILTTTLILRVLCFILSLSSCRFIFIFLPSV